MRPHSLPPSSSFAELLHLMITAHIHRVWLLDEQGVPLSVVTHSDLMRLICCAC